MKLSKLRWPYLPLKVLVRIHYEPNSFVDPTTRAVSCRRLWNLCRQVSVGSERQAVTPFTQSAHRRTLVTTKVK